ncbi:hypothetical protein [Flavimaricola marinus]|uniref:Orotidine 5'-phosphate decarboxylase n=1 Tax=Flavimaricola marinus TaxID=1819565 RepID=A0A238LH08_9RHOB|nr:hypothetical protein [Flavimaricola marinus]SMY09027.1 hypothetical protein LOM8899_03188 [Flavimaricola marinus]
MAHMSVSKINYNANSGMYEARVDVRRGGTTFRYPCAVPGTLVMDTDRVRSRLMQQAERMSDSGSSLRSVI